MTYYDSQRERFPSFMKLPPDFPQNRPAVLLAPMAGYTDLAFRILCAGFGGGMGDRVVRWFVGRMVR